jgi:hypothetical protein
MRLPVVATITHPQEEDCPGPQPLTFVKPESTEGEADAGQ